MNAIMSISFHTQKHAHVLQIIDEAKRNHPRITRSHIVRNLIIDGAERKILEKLLDECEQCINDNIMFNDGENPNPYRWRKDFLKRKQQGQT